MTDALTPEQALQTIAQVRHQRERLTARAAGQVWMVWGLVVGLIGFASQSAYHARYAGGWIDPAFIVIGGGIGAIVTNALWRAHALEREAGHRPWVPWVFGVGGLMALGLMVVLSNMVADGLPPPMINMAPLALMGAYGAAAITAATQHRVPAAPGWIAAALLLVLFLVARFGSSGGLSPSQDFLGNTLLNAANVLVFTLVGWMHVRRG